MIKHIINKLLFCLLLLQTASLSAQVQKPYWNEILAFKKQDSLQSPPQNAILFVGSSSFRGWRNVSEAFPSHTIINRGFGGSSLPDVIQYADDIIFPYKPKQVVIYCGENDLTVGDSITGKTVFERFKTLFAVLRSQQPQLPIAFVSLKPSPSRWHLRDKMIDANKRIKKFLRKQKNTAFIDVWKPMLNSEGLPRQELFLKDNLHMNAEGYAIWQKIVEPYLLK